MHLFWESKWTSKLLRTFYRQYSIPCLSVSYPMFHSFFQLSFLWIYFECYVVWGQAWPDIISWCFHRTVHSGCILVVSLWLFLFSFGRIWTEYKLLQTKSSGLSRSQCHCILWYLELPILYSVCWSMIDFKPLVPWCHVYTGICFYTVEIIF